MEIPKNAIVLMHKTSVNPKFFVCENPKEIQSKIQKIPNETVDIEFVVNPFRPVIKGIMIIPTPTRRESQILSAVSYLEASKNKNETAINMAKIAGKIRFLKFRMLIFSIIHII